MQGINTTMSSHSHRRNESGELDVFAATQYFSSEAYDSCRPIKVERKSFNIRTEAKVAQPQEMMMNYHIKEKVRLKQPSSPRVVLASFISLFNQYYSSSKKKKLPRTLKSTATTTTNSRDSTKRSIMSNDYYYPKSFYYTASCKKREDVVWGDEFKLKINVKKEEIKGFKEEVEEVNDGWSDSSSDLFELKNFDFGLDIAGNHGFPVYEGTKMGSIRRATGFASTVAF